MASDPPKMSESPPPEVNETALFIMDGVLHNLARKKMKASRAAEKALRVQRPVVEQIASGPPPIEPPIKPPSRPPSSNGPAAPLKGILKTPRVHFPDGEPFDPTIIPPPFYPAPPPPSDLPGTVPPLQSPPPPPSSAPPLQPDDVPPPPPEPAPPPPAPLSIFVPAVDEDSYISEVAYRLYTKFMDELSEFVDMQGRVIRSRVMVQEKRQQLKILRDTVSKCDMELMNHLRRCMVDQVASDDPELVQLFEAAQAARDDLGPMESDYEPLEIKLGADEYKLREKYSLIEGRFENFFRLHATSTTKQSVPSVIDYEADSNASQAGATEMFTVPPRDRTLFQGAIIGGKVGVGQLPIRKEELTPSDVALPSSSVTQQTHGSHRHTSSEERTRRRQSTASPDDDHALSVPEDLRGMNMLDAEPGPQDATPRDHRISESLKGMGDLLSISEAPEVLLEELAIDPGLGDDNGLLLLGTDDESQSTLSDYLMSFDSTRDRVNRWILHKLRVSPMEVYELRRLVLERSPNVPNWASMALNLWTKDKAGFGPDYHVGSVEDPFDNVHGQAQATPAYPPAPETKRKTDHRPRISQTSNIANAPEMDEPRSMSEPHEYGIIPYHGTNSI